MNGYLPVDMLIYTYDKSFDGLLSCVFESYNRKEIPEQIQAYQEILPLFSEKLRIITDTDKSDRVYNGLKRKISFTALRMLYVCFLSEINTIEMTIFRYIRKAFENEKSIEMNFADPDVLSLSQIYKKVQKEEERMRQFVRFQKTTDGIFFAYIEPKYNVLPLTIDFFKDRFADQAWILYDAKRKYGFYYDLNQVEEVNFENLDVCPETGRLPLNKMDEKEQYFQIMWKDYLKSVTIQERKNLKLQRQHMPKRIWKFLTEKQ